MHNTVVTDLLKLKAIADTGLLYSKNEYDKERYAELQTIGNRLLQAVSNGSFDQVKMLLPAAADYPTAKVDIRGIAFSADKKVLLIRESADGKWSLPGGWADIGDSPKETAVKEFKEETGLDVVAERLLAVFDKKMHPHPPQPWYVYKMVFHCTLQSFQIHKGWDVEDVQFFDVDALPELSVDRILESQIRLLADMVFTDNYKVYVD